MEIGHIEFVSFEEYKNKALKNIENSNKNKQGQMTDKQIEDEMMKVVEFYEKAQKVGEKENGNI